MTPNDHVRSAYGSAAPVRTNRGAEYAIFARVTHCLKVADAADPAAYSSLAAAVSDNQRLWSLLSEDLMQDENGLPDQLRAQLIGLSEFVRRHSLQVLAGKAAVEPLVEINTSIMRGLRGEAEVSA